METVTSGDGTRLAVERTGSGPPVVCIHGTSASRDVWDGFAGALDGAECVRYDRRGRGDSGDADDYSLAREVADARAVVEHVGDPASVAVFGHSFGGVVAFELAHRTRLGRLVLYEPPVLGGRHSDPGESFADRLRATFEADGPEGVYRTFHRVPEDAALGPDAWADEPPARTVVREAVAVESVDVPDAADVAAPTRCVLGDETADGLRRSTAAVRDAVPGAELVVLDGHGHTAVETAPGIVVSRLDGFLPG
jgi:pimeloyl-ACP methyl ester carboxylesterase